MSMNRRDLIKWGAFAASTPLTFGPLAAQKAYLSEGGFTHCVASGEPSHHSVLLWTRYLPVRAYRDGSLHDINDEALVFLDVEIARNMDFSDRRVVGQAKASGRRDYCAKYIVEGLEPDRWYYYRFTAPDGTQSPIGRTRTLPQVARSDFKLGVFSCANRPYGWFNAYAHAAQVNDMDLIVHLGDYLYEYANNIYPEAKDIVAERYVSPSDEIITLHQYRTRYAQYREDYALRRLHQLYPMISMWDDHELANDAWRGGAENHNPENEGPWPERVKAALRAYHEWLPVSDPAEGRSYAKQYEIGELASIIMPETRISGRDKPLAPEAIIAQNPNLLKDKEALIKELSLFRDDKWHDPTRSLLGIEQESWLAESLHNSTKNGKKWQILAQQTLVGSLKAPAQMSEFANTPGLHPLVKAQLQFGAAAAALGLPFNMDSWDGYPAARQRLFEAALNADAELVVLTGDSHNGWAFDLTYAGMRVGVELAGQSTTSPGIEKYLPFIAPKDLSRLLAEQNEQLIWANLQSRGYLHLTINKEEIKANWRAMETVREKRSTLNEQHSYQLSIAHGHKMISA